MRLLYQKIKMQKGYGYAAGILALALILRLWASQHTPGFVHPDEHFQVIEPLFGLKNGYWLRSWEWQVGMRSWIVPLMLTPVLKLSLFFWPAQDPIAMVNSLKMTLALWSLLIPVVGFLIGRIFLERTWNLLHFGLLCFWWFFLALSPHPLTESMLLPLLMIGQLFFIKGVRDQREWDYLLSAFFFGLCLCFRIQTLFWVSGCGLYLLLLARPRKVRPLIFFTLPLLLFFVLYGMIDWIKQGSWFASLIHYYHYNIQLGLMQSRFGADPWHRYLTFFIRALTLPLALLMMGSLAWWVRSGRQREKGSEKNQLFISLLFPMGLFYFMHFLFAHKEDRFLFPLYPFLFLLLLVPLSQWLQQYSQRTRKVVMSVVVFLMVVGNLYKLRKHDFQLHGDIVHLYEQLRTDPQVQGLLVWGKPLAYTGGYTYLGRPIPFWVLDNPPTRFEGPRIPWSQIPARYNTLLLYQDQEVILNTLKTRGVECKLSRVQTPWYHCQFQDQKKREEKMRKNYE